MLSQLEKIRDSQKEAWNKSSRGWKKWDNMMMDFLEPISDVMISMLRIKDDDIILDVATGTGEPGLTIASRLKHGKVTGTDLAEEMLAIADENAIKLGIKNFETICCDVSALPFENDSYESITSRLGLMFFPDMQLALEEMRRVLKPGGRIAVSVWNIPEENSWISDYMETMISMLQLTPPAPGATGLFRCSQQGFMTDLFRHAGLKKITEKEVAGKLPFQKFEEYWNFITEVACPLAFSKADDSMKNQIKEMVFSRVCQKSQNGNLSLDSSAIVICGEK